MSLSLSHNCALFSLSPFLFHSPSLFLSISPPFSPFLSLSLSPSPTFSVSLLLPSNSFSPTPSLFFFLPYISLFKSFSLSLFSLLFRRRNESPDFSQIFEMVCHITFSTLFNNNNICILYF